MIERITDPEKFEKVVNDIHELFGEQDKNAFHKFLPHNKDCIIACFSNKKILQWDFFVWSNLNKDDKYDAVIAFINNKNEKFAKNIFAEYIWISDNPKVSFKLLGQAMKFAKKQEFEYVSMSAVCESEKFDKICNFYKRMGFVKDSETYVAKI
tara:strand:+ start:1828 stop:2286 length:459 start_codon:yes stop_codon:yes gene_type:complete